jgi:hypothetical protein
METEVYFLIPNQIQSNQFSSTRRASGNSAYKKLAVKWLNEVLFFYQNLLLVESEALQNLSLRQCQKRYGQV